MPILEPGPLQIAYALQGPADAPVLVLSNSLGTTRSMRDAQAEALARDFRVPRCDTRGRGGSGQAGRGRRRPPAPSACCIELLILHGPRRQLTDADIGPTMPQHGGSDPSGMRPYGCMLPASPATRQLFGDT